MKERKEWRLLSIREEEGAMQMAIDEAIAIARSEDKVPDTLRFYIFNPPTITFGYGQQKEKLNIDMIKKKGFGYVRRPTGGTAVLHKDDLTYAIITSEKKVPADVVESYKLLSTGLVLGLKKLGLNAEHRHIRELDKKRTASCYSNENEYDVVVNDKKISGNAQARINGVVLQHGTIILKDNIKELFECLCYHEQAKAELIKKTKQKITNVETELGREVFPQELEKKLIIGFEEAGIILTKGKLTEYEKELADKLYREKYSTDNWNLRR